jgi:predicted permease
VNWIGQDIRHAARRALSSKLLTSSVVMMVGLGVGVNTVVFAWLDNLVSNPFPAVPDGRELVALNVGDMEGRVAGMPPIAYPVLEDWRIRTTSFAAMSAHAQTRLNLRLTPTDPGTPIWVELADDQFFETLQVSASIGRVFTRDDKSQDSAVMVVSHDFWQRRLGAAAGVVGRPVLVNGIPLTVIGVAPERFGGVVMGLQFDAWVPLWQQKRLMPGTDWMRDRKERRLQAIARLSSGVTLLQANQELNRVAREVSRTGGESPVTGAGVRWISDTQLGSLMRPLSTAMLAVTLVVLLTACANIAGLLTAQAVARERQTAILMAIGAGRWRLVRQALFYGLLLSTLACVAGFAIAQATKDSLLVFVPRVALPVSIEIDLNWRVTGFAVVVALMAGLAFTLLPALRASRRDVVEVLKSSPLSGRTGRSMIRDLLVVTQVALSLVSLIIAGLFLRSVSHAGGLPLGFGDPRQVLLVSTDLSFTRLESGALTSLVDRALERIRSLPAVSQASLATFVPLSFGGPAGVNTRIEGYTPAPNESMLIARAAVSDGYFETLAIPIAAGRMIEEGDRASGQQVAVVNEAFVRRYWPGQSPIGKRFDQGGGWTTVVGVAQDSAIDSLTDFSRPLVYVPWAQQPSSSVTLHVRTLVDPLTLVEPVRRELAAVHPDLPALDPGSFADHMRAATFVQSVGASMFTVFGVIALLIAAIGLHGVVAHHVTERRREIAVMVAIGASPAEVLRSVVWPAVRLTSLGLAIGTLLAAGGARFVQSQLIAVANFDVTSILTAVGVLMVVALASCLWPAWQAARLDPVAALRAS